MAPSKLSPDEVKLLAYVEQVFWSSGVILTPSQAARKLLLDEENVARYYQTPKFKNQLKKRGILTDSGIEGVLEPRQIFLVNLIFNDLEKKSVREHLATAKVTPAEYNAWKRDATFQQYVRARGEAIFEGGEAVAYRALMKNVEAGSEPSLKLFFEMRGIYNPRLQVDVNVDSIISGVLDIILRRVSDPSIRQLIASDLEELAFENAGRKAFNKGLPPPEVFEAEAEEVKALPEKKPPPREFSFSL